MKSNQRKKDFLSVVVPVYNEERNIRPFLARVIQALDSIDVNYEIIFCLDPSSDQTLKIIEDEISKNSHIKCMLFSRRFGQPVATMAGIYNCVGDFCVVIDVDLQDPPELIKDMYYECLKGYDVVYAKRITRKGETLIKKIVSYWGYFLINKLSEVQIPRNTGDFRILSRRVIDELKQLNESHGFLRGLVAYVGFKQTYVEYNRDERLAGTGNYNRFLGSLKIGLNGLVSFSSKPLQLMSIIGFSMAGASFGLGFFYLIKKISGGFYPQGLPTTVLLITFIGGLQLMGLGLVGEYIGRIYDESKRRPLYIIDKKINF